MDSEFQMKYRTLLVHHLEKEEIEFELDIRSVPYEKAENVGTLRRRLREVLKKEKDEQIEIDLAKCERRTVDGEINLIDGKVKEISDFLDKEKPFDGIKDSLKTRLVHYFARCSAVQKVAEEEPDLEDLDRLLSTIRELYNRYFTIFSPVESIRKEVLLQISNSLTQLQLTQPSTSGTSKQIPSRSQGTQTDDDLGSQDDQRSNQSSSGHIPVRRQLQSNFNPAMDLLPPGQRTVQQPSDRGISAYRPEEREVVLNRYDLSGRDGTRRSKNDSSDVDSDLAMLQPPPRIRRPRYVGPTRRTRPVSDWNLRYDGRDEGQGLMRFIKEVNFYAKSEDILEDELFRSAIHLFSGVAKVWFMSGVENGDFSSWKELVEEMKKEFLGPDHDHVSEFRAIERKQRPKEKFQDFFFDLQKLFNSLTKPISERKKFEIVFRNLRADYKGYVVAANIDNLADLKPFGRKLDATFWYKFENRTSEEHTTRNRNQVSELKTTSKPKSLGSVDHAGQSRQDRNPPNKTKEENNPKKLVREHQPGTEGQAQNNGVQDKGLKVLLEKYIPPKHGVCYNCRLSGHHHSDCDRPKHKFCFRCGFFNTNMKECPFCSKNADAPV